MEVIRCISKILHIKMREERKGETKEERTCKQVENKQKEGRLK